MSANSDTEGQSVLCIKIHLGIASQEWPSSFHVTVDTFANCQETREQGNQRSRTSTVEVQRTDVMESKHRTTVGEVQLTRVCVHSYPSGLATG